MENAVVAWFYVWGAFTTVLCASVVIRMAVDAVRNRNK